jgi:hypothetical protein
MSAATTKFIIVCMECAMNNPDGVKVAGAAIGGKLYSIMEVSEDELQYLVCSPLWSHTPHNLFPTMLKKCVLCKQDVVMDARNIDLVIDLMES